MNARVFTHRNSALALILLAGCALAAAPASFLHAASLIAPPPASSPQAAPATSTQLLEQVRKALNYRAIAAQSHGVILRGDSELAGVQGESSFLFDPEGRAVSETSGVFATTVGFDGETAWERNEAGVPRTLLLNDREVRTAIFEFMTYSWLSGKTTFKYTFDASAGAPGSYVLSFSRPGTSIKGTVTLDRATLEPRTVVVEGGAHPETIEFSDYADFHDARMYQSVVTRSEDDPPSTFHAREIATAPTYIRSPYQPVFTLPDNFHFDPAVPPRIEIRTAPTKHHLVKAMVDGQDVGWFIFDSGAGTEVLSIKVAEKLALKSFGKIPVRGVGGAVDAAFYQPGSLTLGPVTLDKPLFVGVDLSMLDQFMGVPVAGVIGYGVLGRTVTLVDAKNAYIEIYDSSRYVLQDAQWTDVALYGRHPAVKGSIEGHEGYLRLDTGAADSAITVHAPTVAQFKMLEDRPVKDAMIGGVGGMVPAKTGALSSVTLGGKTFENVAATFALPDKGAMNDNGTLGNVGGVLLDHFVLVFDYPHQRMAFIPRNEKPDAPSHN